MHHTARRQPDSHLDTPALELRWREVSIGSRSSCSSPTIVQIKLDGTSRRRSFLADSQQTPGERVSDKEDVEMLLDPLGIGRHVDAVMLSGPPPAGAAGWGV